VVAAAPAPSTVATAPSAPPTEPTLAATGRQTGWDLLIGLGCVALGGLALYAGRRRAAHR
jgi:LPXTG-motif cell wall-anchored protein